jgi:hypothetical protein
MSTTELLRVSCDTSDGAWRIRLVGEADFSVLDDLIGALQGVAVRPGQEVLLDVGRLQFADVACVRCPCTRVTTGDALRLTPAACVLR